MHDNVRAQGQVQPGQTDKALPPVYTLMYGGIAGILSECVVYPLEVLRRRMQMQSMAAASSSGEAVPSPGRLPLIAATLAMQGWCPGGAACLAQVPACSHVLTLCSTKNLMQHAIIAEKARVHASIGRV